jgi:hypothetical protein
MVRFVVGGDWFELDELDTVRRVDPIGMKDVGEQLGALDQARARPRERRGGVDGDDTLGAQRRNPLGVVENLLPRPRRIPAAGHRDHDLGAGGDQLLPFGRPRLGAGLADDVGAARGFDHLRHPVTADERRVEPLERQHPRPGRADDRSAHRIEAVLQVAA